MIPGNFIHTLPFRRLYYLPSNRVFKNNFITKIITIIRFTLGYNVLPSIILNH